jgi:hypothetical protein
MLKLVWRVGALKNFQMARQKKNVQIYKFKKQSVWDYTKKNG